MIKVLEFLVSYLVNSRIPEKKRIDFESEAEYNESQTNLL